MERLLELLRSERVPRIRAWSVYLNESQRLYLDTKDSETGNAHAPLGLSESLSARYLFHWEDGLVSHGNLERQQIEHEVSGAIDGARAAAYDDPDAAQVRGPAEFPEVPLHDPAVARVASGEVAPLLERLEEVRVRVARFGFRTWSGSFQANEARARLVTSAGLDVSGLGTYHGWYVSLDGELGTGWSGRVLEDRDGYAARLDRLVDHSLRLKQPGRTMPGDIFPVILHPDVVEELVIDTLLHNLDGAVVAHGEGHFRWEQFGSEEPVLREDLTLRLDPLKPLRAGSYRFTVEGVPAAPCTYIDRGRLRTPIVDLKYARRLDVAPTPLPYGLDTVFLEGPAPLAEEEALEEVGEGALVLNVLGVHTLDATSGDFSLAAPQVLRVESGRLGGRLRATLSGNLFELLRSSGLHLVRFEGEHTPGVLLRCRLDPQ